MVDVTAENFAAVFPNFDHELKKCSFVAIDCEFTRLPLDDLSPNFLDTLSDRYGKIWENLDKCFPLQVGIVPFSYDRDLIEYKATIYKFNVFPKFFGPFDPTINFKASTIQFLSKYNFDFNKVFHRGIPFMNRSQRKTVSDMINNGMFLDKLLHSLSFDEKETITSHLDAIRKWLLHSSSGDWYSIEIGEGSPHIKYFLHQDIRSGFKNVWTYDSDLNSSELKVQHLADGERESVQASDDSVSTEALVTSLSGFSLIMEALVRAKKPLVGHNLLIDILSCYHHFHEPAPSDYETFKNRTRDFLPTIYDTKFISNEMKKTAFKDILDNISLQNLFLTFKNNEKYKAKPTIFCNRGSTAEGMQNTAHDAGWDAYMTGFCFVKMMTLLNNANSVDKNSTNAEIMVAAAPFKNRINVTRAFVPYMRLDGPDPPSTRPPYLVVSCARRSKLNLVMIDRVLSDIGSYEVKPLTSYAVTVAAPSYSSYHDVIRRLGKMDEFRVEKYSMLKHHAALRSVLAFSLVVPAGVTAWYWLSK